MSFDPNPGLPLDIIAIHYLAADAHDIP